MAAHTDMAYSPLLFQTQGDFDDFRVENLMEILLGIDIVNHTDVKIAGGKFLKLFFESRHNLRHLSGAEILAVLPHRTQMPLYDKILTTSGKRDTDIAAQFGVGRIDVDEIHTL